MKDRVFILLVIPLLLFSCSREDVGIRRSGPQNREQLISDAQELFLQCQSPVTKGSEDDECFTFKPGVAEVDWESSEYYERRSADIEGVESSYGATFGYRAIFPDSTVVNCDKEFLLVKNQITGDEALFLKYYIPYPGCGTECEWSSVLSNDGDAGDYTGVILYTTLEGYPVRFDQYIDGEYTLGIFLPALDSEEKRADGYEALVEMLGGVTLQRVVVCQTKVTINASYCYGNRITLRANDPLMEETMNEWDDKVNNLNQGLDPNPPMKPSGGGSPTNQEDDTDDSKDKEKDDGEDEETLEEIKSRLYAAILNNSSDEDATEQSKAIIDTILQAASTRKTLADILRNTKNLTKIELVDDALGQPNTFRNEETKIASRIYMPVDALYTDNCIYHLAEELFHFSQQAQNDGFADGDLELEAKVFDCMLWVSLGSDEKRLPFMNNFINENSIYTFIEFFVYRNQKKGDAAVSILRKMGYSEIKFPSTRNKDSEYFLHFDRPMITENGF